MTFKVGYPCRVRQSCTLLHIALEIEGDGRPSWSTFDRLLKVVVFIEFVIILPVELIRLNVAIGTRVRGERQLR